MKATIIKKPELNFEPFDLIIRVESKTEEEVLKRLVNLSRDRSIEVVNSPYAEHAHINPDIIKVVTDSIHYGLESIYYEENIQVPMSERIDEVEHVNKLLFKVRYLKSNNMSDSTIDSAIRASIWEYRELVLKNNVG